MRKVTTGDDSFGIQILIDFLNNHLKSQRMDALKTLSRKQHVLNAQPQLRKKYRARQARLAVVKDTLKKDIASRQNKLVVPKTVATSTPGFAFKKVKRAYRHPIKALSCC